MPPLATVPAAPCPSDLPDAELCRLIREGDRGAGDVIVRRHEPMCWKIVNGFRAPGVVERDDLMSVARIALWRSALKWNPASTTGSKFSTYAFAGVMNAVSKELKRQLRNPFTTDPDALPETVPAREDAPEPAAPPPVIQPGTVAARLAARVDGTEGSFSRAAAGFGMNVQQARRVVSAALVPAGG